jgi:hypothetical protein
MKTWSAFSVVVLVVVALVWLNSSSVSGAAHGPAPVQIVPGGQKQVGNPGEKGATYYALEGQTARLTTRFRDGFVAVSERGLIGDVRTTLYDQAGNERARLRSSRIDDVHGSLNYEPSDGPTFQAVTDPTVKPTLDWVTQQAYSLAKDGTTNLVWDRGIMRPKSTGRRDVGNEIMEVETVWANGLVAKLTRQTYSRREIAPGRFVQGPAMVTELTVNGVHAGTGVWFERDQVFAYLLPGLTASLVYIGPEHLKRDYGGWPFKPDTTWLNLQTIGLHHFKTLMAKQGFVASNCEAGRPNRVAQFFFPTIYANEPGCDGLHWLDGTFLRECCDDHDRCYSKSGCTQSSWWLFWKSWSCDACNMAVVSCFAAGTGVDQCFTRAVC